MPLSVIAGSLVAPIARSCSLASIHGVDLDHYRRCGVVVARNQGSPTVPSSEAKPRKIPESPVHLLNSVREIEETDY